VLRVRRAAPGEKISEILKVLFTHRSEETTKLFIKLLLFTRCKQLFAHRS
jgi:hypothetical protein